MEQPTGVDQPDHRCIKVLVALLDQSSDCIDHQCQERSYLFITVDVISMTNAHENDVSW